MSIPQEKNKMKKRKLQHKHAGEKKHFLLSNCIKTYGSI